MRGLVTPLIAHHAQLMLMQAQTPRRLHSPAGPEIAVIDLAPALIASALR
jgi:hypothetical protein